MSLILQIVPQVWAALQGYRTYLASTAAILSALAGLAGVLPSATSQGLAVAFGALAAICLRLSQADHALTLMEALQALEDAKAAYETVFVSAEPIQQPEPPATIPFTGSPFPAGRVVPMLLCALSLVIAGASVSSAQDRPPVLTSMQLSPDTRSWFGNPDGSCVQCSIGMAGVHCNDINAASLLWDTPYGPAVRGGSGPSRVEAYCDQRGIQAWSVTGATVEDTIPWMTWAAKTGRFAAIGAGRSHFQTLYGYDPGDARPWRVCNNNSTQQIDRYTDREFKQLHAASGPWVVILQRASSDPPVPTKWWK